MLVNHDETLKVDSLCYLFMNIIFTVCSRVHG